MARERTRESKSDSMSVLGESYPLLILPGEKAVYPQRLHELEVSSWFERPRHNQPSECKKYMPTKSCIFQLPLVVGNTL